jgi:mono/diheme cytochrome c family protein
VARLVLNGRGGMPAFRNSLSDDQLAAIITYVRSAWGNKAPPVTAATVAAARISATPPPRGIQAH